MLLPKFHRVEAFRTSLSTKGLPLLGSAEGYRVWGTRQVNSLLGVGYPQLADPFTTLFSPAQGHDSERSAEGIALCRGVGCPHITLLSPVQAARSDRSAEGIALCRGVGCPHISLPSLPPQAG